MVEYEDLYKKWELYGKLDEGDVPHIERATPDHESLSEFLANKIDTSENIAQLLSVVAFTNCLLSKHGGIVGALQNMIKAIIDKLKQLATTLGGVYFHIEVGIGVHISITFQINPIDTK
jgi:hypothetical protein